MRYQVRVICHRLDDEAFVAQPHSIKLVGDALYDQIHFVELKYGATPEEVWYAYAHALDRLMEKEGAEKRRRENEES